MRTRLLIAAYVLVTGFATAVYALDGLASLDRASVDARFRVRGARPPDPGIVIVAVDDRTLGAINRVPPIPRRYYARALDRIRAAGARLIVVDVQFIGAGPSRADDDALVAAIARDGPVVLAAPDFGDGPASVPAGRPATPGYVTGAPGVDPDPDGILRRMMYRQVDRPTLAVRVAERLTGRPVRERFDDNHAWIDFRGGPGTFPTSPPTTSEARAARPRSVA